MRTLTNTITLLMYDPTPELFARKWSLLQWIECNKSMIEMNLEKLYEI